MIKKDYELVIKNGYVADGSGNPWYKADVGIKDGRIATIGSINEKDSYRFINAKDLIVSPGFIDLHNHSDLSILARPFCESNIMQGITTAVVGNCGISMAPINKVYLPDLKEYVAPFLLNNYDYGWEWNTLEEYYRKVEKNSIAINLVPLVGHGTLRIAVKGFSQEPLTREEMNKMKSLLSQSLEDGAFGLSTGLVYPPGTYSNTEELIELGSILREYDGIYATHIRNEGRDLVESIQEAIKIGKTNNIPVQISHHKAKGKSNWGKIHYTLRMLEEEREKGLEIGCDVYPYTVGSTTITSILPAWVLEGGVSKMLERLKSEEQRKKIKKDFIDDNIKEGNDIKDAGFEGIIIASCENKKYAGMSLMQIIKMKGETEDPFEAMFDLILELKGNATINKFIMNEQDVQFVLSHPLSAIITDSWATKPCAEEKPHPRAYGTFPKVLGRYVRERKLLRLEEAIRKSTSYPASIIRLKERGLLLHGYWADMVIFNPDTILDKATYQDPNKYSLGIDYVIVNGEVTVEKGNLSEKRYGKVIRRYNL